MSIWTFWRNKAPPTPANNSLVQKALEVGERLRDGTVCIAVDLNKNESLRVPAEIFGGEAPFDKQHEVPVRLNAQRFLGHDDWRNITDEEGRTLAEVWDKVAPPALQDAAAPSFWLASPNNSNLGHVRRGSEADWRSVLRDFTLPVPAVRSGPAVYAG